MCSGVAELLSWNARMGKEDDEDEGLREVAGVETGEGTINDLRSDNDRLQKVFSFLAQIIACKLVQQSNDGMGQYCWKQQASGLPRSQEQGDRPQQRCTAATLRFQERVRCSLPTSPQKVLFLFVPNASDLPLDILHHKTLRLCHLLARLVIRIGIAGLIPAGGECLGAELVENWQERTQRSQCYCLDLHKLDQKLV